MKKSILLLLLALMSVATFAQERKISGTLADRDSKEAVMQATVHLLKPDSTFVTGTLTDEDGHFSVSAPEDGK